MNVARLKKPLLVLLLGCAVHVAFAAIASKTAQEESPRETLLLTTINAVVDDQVSLMLRSADGRLWIAATELRRWRVQVPDAADTTVDGVDYYALSHWPRAKFSIDEATQQLDLTLPSDAFETAVFTKSAPNLNQATPPSLGAFLTYDALTERTVSIARQAGTVEVGTFGAWGVASVRYLVESGRDKPAALRLDSSWIRDFPDKMTSFRLGDGITRAPSGWGGATRYSGISYGTNFGTRPGFALLPDQLVSGAATAPSTVDVYVNNALVTRQLVPPGPYSIARVPLVAGANVLQVRVRDVLGREQVYERSLFSSAQLLRQGLDDYAIELGKVRNNFAVVSNDYGVGFLAANWRHGINDTLTAETHLELAEKRTAVAGVGANFTLGQLGLMNFAVAGSTKVGASGYSVAAGWSRPGARLSTAISTQWSSRDFWQLATSDLGPGSRFSIDSVVAMNLGQIGSVTVGYSRLIAPDPRTPTLGLVSLTWSTLVRRKVYVGLSARRLIGVIPSTDIGLIFSTAVDHQTSGSSFLQRNDDGTGGRTAAGFDYQKSLPLGTGWGYRLRANAANDVQVGSSYQNDIGTVALELARQSNGAAARIGVQGSVVLLGGQLFASRRANDAFALVRVPGFAGVRVYNGNQWVGTTDSRGNAIVPRLMAYQPNALSIDDRDLPLDVEVAHLQRTAVPVYRSGVIVDFDVRRIASAQLRIVDARGAVIEPGAHVRLAGVDRDFLVTDDGRLFLSGLMQRNTLRVDHENGVCRVNFDFSPTADPLPDLGTLVCEEVTP